MALSAAKRDRVAGLFAVAPQDALHRLIGLLGTAAAHDPMLEPVRVIASAEADLRRTVAAVFAPLWPLAEGGPAPKQMLIRKSDLTEVWRRIDGQHDQRVQQALAVTLTGAADDNAAPVLDEVCALAADAATSPELARWLRLAPVLRRVQPRVEAWARNLSGENVAAIRLAFRDALAVDEDAGPAFWEAIFAMLEQPWQAIRLISAATDRPSDRYLAGSELAGLAERLLDDIDRRIVALKSFDPLAGEAEAIRVSGEIGLAVQIAAEFEAWLTLSADGPWGRRIQAQKRAIALAMEARLREVEPAVALALPTQPVRGAGRGVRPVPKLSADLGPIVVARAEALLALAEDARRCANAAGFAALRSKVCDAVAKRLDQYCEDLLETIHQGDPEQAERSRAYLDIAAHFMGLIEGPQNAQNIRRRAAAA